MTLTEAAWFQDVNTVTYTLFGNGTSYTGVLNLTGTTDATSITTGQSKNAGGASIQKALWVGGLANIAGALTLGGKLTSSFAGGGDFVAAFTNTTNTTPYTVLIREPATPTSGFPLLLVDNSGGGTVYFRVDSGTGAISGAGGLVLGAPTGGNKGAGTANFAADIYKNNTAYTNPDYVLEHWATGKVEKFADKTGAKDYPGLMPLQDVEQFAREKLHLPRFGQEAGHGLFGGSDALLASVEELYLYVFQLSAEFGAYKASHP